MSYSLQYIPVGNTCQCNTSTEESRICILLPSTDSLLIPSFMDHHSSCFIGRFGETMEDVYAPEGEIPPLTRFPTTETPGSIIFTLSITRRIRKHGQHLYILQTSHMHNNSITTKRTLLQWNVTLEAAHQEKPLTILWRCSQLAHWNSHNQGYTKHLAVSHPADRNTEPTPRNLNTCHLNTECYQICHASQQAIH